MTNYDEEYKQCEAACGLPFKEFVDFFATAKRPLTVLDLGCGQGRDAVVAAHHGHDVHAIDIAASGIDQLSKRVSQDGLSIITEVTDIESFDTDRGYDVVVLDRVLHMLPSDYRRLALLGKLGAWLDDGGYVLVADTKRNRGLILGFFEGKGWSPILKKRDLLIVQRSLAAHPPPDTTG